jgi:hypothetical protein
VAVAVAVAADRRVTLCWIHCCSCFPHHFPLLPILPISGNLLTHTHSLVTIDTETGSIVVMSDVEVLLDAGCLPPPTLGDEDMVRDEEYHVISPPPDDMILVRVCVCEPSSSL